MKKSLLFLFAAMLVLFGCDKTINDIVETEPSITGIVKDISAVSITIVCDAADDSSTIEYKISLDTENEDSYEAFVIGDEVIVYDDGNVTAASTPEINNVYAITLKSPANWAINEHT